MCREKGSSVMARDDDDVLRKFAVWLLTPSKAITWISSETRCGGGGIKFKAAQLMMLDKQMGS